MTKEEALAALASKQQELEKIYADMGDIRSTLHYYDRGEQALREQELAKMVAAVEAELAKLVEFADEHHLHFSVETDGLYATFDAHDYGHWAHSSC